MVAPDTTRLMAADSAENEVAKADAAFNEARAKSDVAAAEKAPRR